MSPRSLAEEKFIKIRTVYLGMAHGAGLILGILCVEARDLRDVTAGRRRVTLQAEQIHLACP